MGRQGWTHRSDSNTKAIVAALRAAGHDVHFIDRPVDLLVAIRGVWVLIEVKSSEGRLTSDQQKFFKTTTAPAFVITSVDEAIDIANQIGSCILAGNTHDIRELGRNLSKDHRKK